MQVLCLIGSCVFFCAGLWLFFVEDMRAADKFKAWRTTLFYLAMLGFIAFLFIITILTLKGGK